MKPSRLALLLLLAGLALSVQAQTPATTEWKRYELGQGNFSVVLPSQPKEELESAPSSVGIPIDLYTYAVGTEAASFVAQYGVLGEGAEKWSESAKEYFHNGVWSGASKSFDKQMEENKFEFRSKLVEKRNIKFNGYDGREVTFTLGPFQGRIWTAIIGRQTFTAMALGAESTLADQQKFLNSFTIKLKPLGTSTKQP